MENNFFDRKDTYILIPAYKPDHLLIELLQKLKAEDFDVVVVNDGGVKTMNQFLKKPKNTQLFYIKIQIEVKALRLDLVLLM